MCAHVFEPVSTWARARVHRETHICITTPLVHMRADVPTHVCQIQEHWTKQHGLVQIAVLSAAGAWDGES